MESCSSNIYIVSISGNADSEIFYRHVAKGAVLVKMYERRGFITRRPIKRSKAVTTWYRVTDEIRESAIYPFMHTKISKNDGLEYFWAAQWLAKQVSNKTNNGL